MVKTKFPFHSELFNLPFFQTGCSHIKPHSLLNALTIEFHARCEGKWMREQFRATIEPQEFHWHSVLLNAMRSSSAKKVRVIDTAFNFLSSSAICTGAGVNRTSTFCAVEHTARQQYSTHTHLNGIFSLPRSAGSLTHTAAAASARRTKCSDWKRKITNSSLYLLTGTATVMTMPMLIPLLLQLLRASVHILRIM